MSERNAKPDNPASVRVRLTGRVQGVGFRNWTERHAGALGLSGWVRNCADGTVEALFAGPPENVDAMLERALEGPRTARVEAIEVLERDAGVPAGPFRAIA